MHFHRKSKSLSTPEAEALMGEAFLGDLVGDRLETPDLTALGVFGLGELGSLAAMVMSIL